MGAILMLTPPLVAHNGYTDAILVSTDATKGPFEKTLVLIGEHTVDGAIGLILNKPLTEDDHQRLSPFIRDSGIPVAYGGPIDVSSKIFVLTETKPGEGDKEPDFDISEWDDAVHDTPDLLDKIKASVKKGEQHYRVFAGFSAWGPFQLEWEAVVKHGWYTVGQLHDYVFQNGANSHWDKLNGQEKAKDKDAPPGGPAT
jgi:putative transcriptional regulator